MGNATDKWYLSGTLGIGTAEPGKMLHIQGSSSAPLLNDSHDRPGLAITGSYPELDLFSEADNPNHGPTIRLGSYNNDKKDTFKQWVIGTSGRDSSFLDIGFSDRNDPNPHAGIRNYNGKTLFTILQNGNVGIGTTTPKASLEVMQTFFPFFPVDPIILQPVLRDLKTVTLFGELTTGLRFFSQHNPNVSSGGVINSCDADGTVRPLTLQMNGGNVGIGTANPTHPLHVKTNWGFLALDSNAAGQDSGLRLMEGGAVKWHIWNSANDAKFYLARDGLAATLALDKSGNVDIGLNPLRFSSGWTGSPDNVTNRAEISNDTESFKTLMIIGNKSAGMGRRVSVWDRLEVNGELIVTGNQTIGASISYGGQLNKLDVGEGDTFAYIRAHDLWFGHSSRRGGVGRALVDLPKKFDDEILNTLRINFEADWGAVVIGGRVETPSSRRLKENIQILSSQVARKIITTLEPVTFTYKQDDLKLECLGFIAEDAPSEVTLPTKDTVTFNHIVAALTRVVKDQEQSIRELKAQVNLLKK